MPCGNQVENLVVEGLAHIRMPVGGLQVETLDQGLVKKGLSLLGVGGRCI